ncbi:MAG: hypothetical protein M0R17_01890 [Candidatus Omnitrophica bacterium]|jgi:hypothetical protein|nr:hypothetical protein [Candidatus Omnitrophota bacterium]
MYSEMKFAEYIQPVRTRVINDAINVAKDLTVKPVKTTFEKLSINSDGNLISDVYPEGKIMSRYAFEKLYKILGISGSFALKIPLDLLLTNIHRLLGENSSDAIVMLERPDGSVAGFVKKEYEEASYLDILSCFSDREAIQYIDIGEVMLTICLGFQKTKFKDPKSISENDFLMAGSHVYGSILKETQLKLESILYRTYCTNSFVMPFFGKIRADYRLEPEPRLLEFSKNVEHYDEELLKAITINSDGIEERRLFEFEVASLFRKLQKYVGSSTTDTLIGTNEEERKLILQRVDIWREENKRNKMFGLAINEPSMTNFMAYDVLNKVTNYAASVHESTKRSIEVVAGTALGNILLGVNN